MPGPVLCLFVDSSVREICGQVQGRPDSSSTFFAWPRLFFQKRCLSNRQIDRHSSSSPRSGVLRTQKSKPHLLRTQSSQVPGVGQNIVMPAMSTARNFFLANFYDPGLSPPQKKKKKLKKTNKQNKTKTKQTNNNKKYKKKPLRKFPRLAGSCVGPQDKLGHPVTDN